MFQEDPLPEAMNEASVDVESDLIPTYLRRVASASSSLAQGVDPMEVEDFPLTSDCQQYIDRIARDLLRACRLDVMMLSTQNLPEPKLPPVDLKRDLPRDEAQGLRWRRTDFLRALLRAMAPIAMDVAAHVGSILDSKNNDAEGAISQENAQAFFILSSVWLPIAPQITPLVSELFSMKTFPCPLEEIKISKTIDNYRIFLLAEASLNICSYYSQRNEISLLHKWWNWSPAFLFMNNQSQRQLSRGDDEEMAGVENQNNHHDPLGFWFRDAIQWFAPRIVAYLFQLPPRAKGTYIKKLGVGERRVPWVPHPWVIDEEEANAQMLQLSGKALIWDEKPFAAPSVESIRKIIRLHPWLVHVGDGIVYVKHDAISAGKELERIDDKCQVESSHNFTSSTKDKVQNLIRTATTAENLALLGAAMCTQPHPPPILICGPHGSGKSSLVRELAVAFSPSTTIHRDQLLEIHVDEETDAKTLIGSYTMTDIPGEFVWKPGALTQAVRQGKWVLMEDIDSIPIEIQAALVKLLEDRVLPLGVTGDFESCHPNFRLFGTLTTAGLQKGRSAISRRKKVLSSSLWRNVYVKPLPFSELEEVALSLYPSIPRSICQSSLSVLKALDRSGRDLTCDETRADEESETNVPINNPLSGGRHPSVRDFFKLLSRISQGIVFERNIKYATESQRTLCMAESVDIFLSACPDREIRRSFIRNVIAPIWGLTADLALSYLESRRPTTQALPGYLEVGRARLQIKQSNLESERAQTDTFTETSSALRLMETIAVGIRENEPLLLVGETGCGKTSIVQHLAEHTGRELIVQNLSLQTDSTDLLGGFRPLQLRRVAQTVYQSFVDIFVATFSRNQNAKFLAFASSALAKQDWKKLSQCFVRAAKLGLEKIKQRSMSAPAKDRRPAASSLELWKEFSDSAQRFERQRLACDSGLVFGFTEGALVDAIREGKWVLLDEINLASSEILQRLCGLLDDHAGSLTLTERGDAVPIRRHPEFRLFAAMNPATDAGKKDLHGNIRSRFTEIYVDELLDPVELRVISSRYLNCVLPQSDKPPEHTDVVVSSVNVYLRCRELAHEVLVDGGGHRPRYTLRTLARAMIAAKNLVLQQRLPLNRAIAEGFELVLQGPLDPMSVKAVHHVIKTTLGSNLSKNEKDHPGRRPGKADSLDYILVKPFWIKAGPLTPEDWSSNPLSGRGKFILTPSAAMNLRRLTRAIVAGPWPILLEGPTSSGKTTLVEYIAARSGHRVVRINNHEHTDVQEYTGSFAPDSRGTLSFQDGILVRALKRGDWVILDELNLAPSEVLEALNRLLDDNRELYLSEINETIKPHPDFRLFATQNPTGAYGGRKPLSRAFRNRFVELHIADIPSSEMVTILEQRCSCPPSHSRALVAIMDSLRHHRSKSGIFLGKDGLITPRDLLRWAERHATSKVELAQNGYMLLAERLRTSEEKETVREEIEKQLNVKVDLEELYYGTHSAAMKLLKEGAVDESLSSHDKKVVSSIAPTKSILRLINLVLRCIEQKEPVLLVGDTGCGKTTVVELLSVLLGNELKIVNCHATTETSDLIGGLRPIRGRNTIALQMLEKVRELMMRWPDQSAISLLDLPSYLNREGCSASESLDIGADNCFGDDNSIGSRLPEGAVTEMITIVRSLWSSGSPNRIQQSLESPRKKLKIAEGDKGNHTNKDCCAALSFLVNEIEELDRRYSSLFEWADGPVAGTMKAGHMLLLDELSLAEDAVLERLNSVLEPSRTLVLAEKGEDLDVESDHETRVIRAHNDFRIFATMNPGGDFGKRELSPALRSRFTEIWVPAIVERSDIELVLGCCFAGSDDGLLLRKCMIPAMLTYVDWFNSSICNGFASPYAGLSLSLRDILAWSQFVVTAREANQRLEMWDAYCHGAALMHLDGLGLGTGMSSEETLALRSRAREFLLEQTNAPNSITAFSHSIHKRSVAMSGSRFGVHPFWIGLGQHAICKTTFDFSAPRTSENIYRVLRAMQLPKAVLLEGSPGVGKTSLVLALAKAAGHRLVRINLSEQTDMSDLMGSDLPVPEKNCDGVTRASFKWCDGVLLTAIKNGDWVLLDELNLASQSVLEGLNSCLDYRANVFIPELGRTFRCPPSFRVFAAQNPMAQGGGRKGLPRSFLNRFTKVFVDPLTKDDFETIVSSKYPTLSPVLVSKMVNFNERVHSGIVEQNDFGHSGSPWEFNLRDIFRWADLIVSEKADDYSKSCACFATLIYLQRLRTERDRERLKSIYFHEFGTEITTNAAVGLSVTEEAVQIGDAVLPRFKTNIICGHASRRTEPALHKSCLRPMEAIARCVQMNWPCLLVGTSGTGKTSALTALSELCGAALVEVHLSPSSDVSELIGCFEQVDIASNDHNLLLEVERFASAYVLSYNQSQHFNNSVPELLFHMKSIVEGLEVNQKIILSQNQYLRTTVFSLIEKLELAARNTPDFEAMHGEMVRIALDYVKTGPDKLHHDAHFQWVDGILVRAMIEGSWLLLENVNLCPASVLDRLNSVMEKNGELLVAECGVQEDELSILSHRVVKPHPNFRLFLSMDPDNGEISRAMRNRCVEISFLPPSTYLSPLGAKGELLLVDKPFIDSIDISWRAGLRSSRLTEILLENYCSLSEDALSSGFEPPCIRVIAGSALLLSCLLKHGLSSNNTWRRLSSLFGFKGLPQTCNDSFLQEKFSQKSRLVTSPSFREGWMASPDDASIDWDGRLLRLFMSWQANLPPTSVLFPYGSAMFSLSLHVSRELSMKYESFCPSVSPKGCDIVYLRNFLAMLFLADSSSEDMSKRLAYFDGHPDPFTETFRAMAKPFQEASKGFSIMNFALKPSSINNVELMRLPQKILERVWKERVQASTISQISLQDLAVLDVSFYMYEGYIERTATSCQVTPILYPFLRTVDLWIDDILDIFIQTQASKETEIAKLFAEVLSKRDRFWLLMSETQFTSTEANFLAFDETKFIVLWEWFKKALKKFNTAFQLHELDATRSKRSHINILVETVDTFVFGVLGPGNKRAFSIWSKIGHPLVPRRAKQWLASENLRALGMSCSLENFLRQSDRSDNLQLVELITCGHSSLVFHEDDRKELLQVICTVHWLSTDETAGQVRDGQLSLSPEQLSAAMIDKWEAKRKEFNSQVEAMKVDESIDTVENLIEIEQLNELAAHGCASKRSHLSSFVNQVLCNFGRLQLAACSEKWCANEEFKFLREICRWSLDPKGASELVALAPSVQRFVDAALYSTNWSISDLRPYQTFIWICESSSLGEQDVITTIRRILPVIVSSTLQHSIAKIYDSEISLSMLLEMPGLSDTNPVSGISCRPRHRASRHDHAWLETQTLFDLVGGVFLTGHSKMNKSSFATIENHSARAVQSRDFLRILSSSPRPPRSGRPYEIIYFLSETMQALGEKFPYYTENETLQDVFCSDDFVARVPSMAYKCTHSVVQELFEPVVLPLCDLLNTMCRADHGPAGSYSANGSLLYAYFGLLRFHLLLPDSPLDPGRKPQAKCELLESHLKDLRTQVTAIRLHSGFRDGDFSPESEFLRELLDEGLSLETRCSLQEKKIVERPNKAPPFVDFFRESKDFAENFCNKETVLAIIGMVQRAKSSVDVDTAKRRVENWQQSVGAFCDRLLKHFRPYEDVASPLVDALRFLQMGLHELVEDLPSDATISNHTETLRLCLEYPIGDVHNDLAGLQRTMQSFPSNSKSGVDCKLALAFTILSRLTFRKLTSGLGLNTIETCGSIFTSLLEYELGDKQPPRKYDDEDQGEKSFREQFPDHRKDFTSSLRIHEETDVPESSDDVEDSESCAHSGLSADDILKLCYIHRILFSPRVKITDSDRILLFKESFTAAVHICESYGYPSQSTGTEMGTAAHAFALGLASPLNCNLIPKDIFWRQQKMLENQFYTGPNPEEVLKATQVIEHLAARVEQLQTAFPGNEILFGIANVTSRVKKLDLHTTSVGKVMTGLELILRYAQEWEQHASERVKLGNSLLEVSQLVATWRKLELQSWKDLLASRQERFLKQARGHWARLYKLLRAEENKNNGNQSAMFRPASDQWAPRWVWKGLVKYSRVFAAVLFCADNSDLVELAKALDTFVLTSPLGEFKERLELLKTFSEQLRQESETDDTFCFFRLRCSRMLSSLSHYYEQFLALLSSKLEALGAPIESKLRDQIKLAKWDEQSYYALAESSEKNHRNLMRCLRDYDEILGLNVGVLLDQDLSFGIRSGSSAEDEGSASVPTDSIMFPLTGKGEKDAIFKYSPSKFIADERNWTELSLIHIPTDSYAGKISRYASKIRSLVNEQTLKNSWSELGTSNAHCICDNIFHRIEVLRAEKTSRQMKERGLVDLFKALKQNGYTNTKLSTPGEIRDTVELFQCPSPTSFPLDGLEDQLKPLTESEKYSLRFISELKRLRSEVDAFGSQHMTQRQTEMMINFCEQGLLMIIQQRSLLSAVLADRASLRRRAKALSSNGNKAPTCQNGNRESHLKARAQYNSAVENIHQLALLIKVCQRLLRGHALGWATDATKELELVLMELGDIDPMLSDFITEDDLKRTALAEEKLRKAFDVVLSHHKQNVELACLPLDAFEHCIAHIEGAISAHAEALSGQTLSQPDLKREDPTYLISSVSEAVKCLLLGVQTFQYGTVAQRPGIEYTAEEHGSDTRLWDCHLGASREWAGVNLKRLAGALEDVLKGLESQMALHCPDSSEYGASLVGLVSDLGHLCDLTSLIFDKQLRGLIQFHRHSAKLHYILIRVFRVLVSKGFCSDETLEENGENAKSGGMNFEDDVEGTGMGEGDGKEDVTDQLENEEQLLGLENQSEQGETGQNKHNQLNEDEAKQGMEMEGHFDGDMHDMPEKLDPEGENNEDGDGKEELDREMGLEDDPNEEVVDEKLWEESDDEKDMGQGDEKFEKNSSVKGGQDEDQVRTREDDEENVDNNRPKEEGAKQNPANGDQKAEEEELDEQSKQEVNEDLDGNYEDSHNIEVRMDAINKEEQIADDDAMELDDNLQIEEDNNSGDDGEDVEHEGHSAMDEQESKENQDLDPEAGEDEKSVDEEDGSRGMENSRVAALGEQDESNDEDSQDEAEPDAPKLELPQKSGQRNQGLGIRDVEGQDACQDTPMEVETNEGDGTEAREEVEASGHSDHDGGAPNHGALGNDENGNEGAAGQDEKEKEKEGPNDAPNPFKNPGDATRFWHQRLNMVDTGALEQTSEENDKTPDGEQGHATGEFEFVSEEQANTTQVLGAVAEDQAVELEHPTEGEDKAEESGKSETVSREKAGSNLKQQHSMKARPETHNNYSSNTSEDLERVSEDDASASDENGENQEEDEVSEASRKLENDEFGPEKRVVSDLSRLNVGEHDPQRSNAGISFLDYQTTGISSAEISEARATWSRIQSETHNLALRLCEKLRLVMEPLIASKLRGDYRTGKRINMKRVIGYIASAYRKDKIWLRRTKPAKRNYRVLLAVDDSESMLKCGTGGTALRAMATLAVGMSQLEIGELGIASFGDDMKLLHPFHEPFTSTSGVEVIKNFKFDQPRTRTALCVESALKVLDTPSDTASVQLMFLISDGRIERDSRAALRRLIREMMERNILLAMVIVEGADHEQEAKNRDSIMNMKEVTFERGKPKVKRFIEDYPFPYYLVIDNMQTLPEVLGDALRQWFEMLSQLQETR